MKSISKHCKCADCLDLLHHGVADPCPRDELIVIKSYNIELAQKYDRKHGLGMPSGSVVRLLQVLTTLHC